MRSVSISGCRVRARLAGPWDVSACVCLLAYAMRMKLGSIILNSHSGCSASWSRLWVAYVYQGIRGNTIEARGGTRLDGTPWRSVPVVGQHRCTETRAYTLGMPRVSSLTTPAKRRASGSAVGTVARAGL